MITKTAQRYYYYYLHTHDIGLEKTAFSVQQISPYAGRAFNWMRDGIRNNVGLNDTATILGGVGSAIKNSTINGAVATGNAIRHPIQTAVNTPRALVNAYTRAKNIATNLEQRGKAFLRNRIEEEKAKSQVGSPSSVRDTLRNTVTAVKNNPGTALRNSVDAITSTGTKMKDDFVENVVRAGKDMWHNTATNIRSGQHLGAAVKDGAKQTVQQHPDVPGYFLDMVDPSTIGPFTVSTLATGGIPLGVLPVSPLKRLILGRW